MVVTVFFLSPLHNDCELKSMHTKQDNTVEADRNQEVEQATLAGEVMVLGETWSIAEMECLQKKSHSSYLYYVFINSWNSIL